jgi:uncharacterized protein
MRPLVATIILLSASNVFMTFAWYAHLRNLSARPWIVAALASWGIALFEYLLQVPANRIGYATMSLGQLKILQEIIALTVFVPFAVLYMRAPLDLDYLWAALCIAARPTSSSGAERRGDLLAHGRRRSPSGPPPPARRATPPTRPGPAPRPRAPARAGTRP